MASPTEYTSNIPGFRVDLGNIATPSSVPDPTHSLRENHELIQDLCRYAENLTSESAVRKRWRLSEEMWEALGADDALVRAVEDEKTRRIRSGATKRERAQLHVVRGPDVLASIMDDPKANAKHRVDSIKALDALADPGPEAAAEQERVFITINMSSDTKDPKDILTIEATPRPKTPKQIDDDHSEPNDEWRR